MTRRVRRGIFLLAYLAVGLVAVHEFGFTVTSMASPSMAPTLSSNVASPDRVLVDRLTPRFRPPERGEIVHFRDQQGTWVMKRVLGLPGETIEIRDGRVLADGKPLEVPRPYRNSGHMVAGAKMKIDPGYYFVLGDDTADSYDSRFWGCLARTSITGYARAVVWPPDHVKSL